MWGTESENEFCPRFVRNYYFHYFGRDHPLRGKYGKTDFARLNTLFLHSISHQKMLFGFTLWFTAKKGINIAIFHIIFAEKYLWTYIFHIFSKIWMFCFYVQKIPLSYLVVAKRLFVMILNILGYQTNFNASETLSNLIWKQPLTGVLHKLSVLPTTNSSKVRFKFLTKSLKNTFKRVHF